MRTAVFYFSGTGNTERVVQTWITAAKEEGIEAEAFRMEDQDPVSFEQYDRIGIAYPIHAFNAPQIVLDFAEGLPLFDEPKEFYLIMVSGEPLRLNDSSDQKLKKILKKKNAVVNSRWHYIMPYNMIFRHTEQRAAQMKKTMEALVPLDVKQYFREGATNSLRPLKGTGFLTAAFRIEHLFSHVNGKHFRVTTKCIQCMQCVQNCPVGNIEYVDGAFRFHDNCILCVRCSFCCPMDAIRIGLLNGWRVNGPYRFRPPEKGETDLHPGFCKKSYANYFASAQERVEDGR